MVAGAHWLLVRSWFSLTGQPDSGPDELHERSCSGSGNVGGSCQLCDRPTVVFRPVGTGQRNNAFTSAATSITSRSPRRRAGACSAWVNPLRGNSTILGSPTETGSVLAASPEVCTSRGLPTATDSPARWSTRTPTTVTSGRNDDRQPRLVMDISRSHGTAHQPLLAPSRTRDAAVQLRLQQDEFASIRPGVLNRVPRRVTRNGPHLLTAATPDSRPKVPPKPTPSQPHQDLDQRIVSRQKILVRQGFCAWSRRFRGHREGTNGRFEHRFVDSFVDNNAGPVGQVRPPCCTAIVGMKESSWSAVATNQHCAPRHT